MGTTEGSGEGCSGSRKAVTSGAFPGNRASVPCNAAADRGGNGTFHCTQGAGEERGGAIH